LFNCVISGYHCFSWREDLSRPTFKAISPFFGFCAAAITFKPAFFDPE
jgi:hypothetical protein